MALKEQQKAPDFELESTSGKNFKLSEKAGEPIILFFYPKNFTKVCTAEVCEFRDAFSEFRDLNVKVVGVSQDTISSHQKFKKENKLPFELLSDPKGKVAKLYKATIPVIGMNRRITYLLDKDLRIKAVYENMFTADQHVKQMIEKL
ncbi:peroxiredoxin [Marivirga tractuosa]|uniref:thioredoxin-dependent peroxiredoxin n=1 Tax=Marivirga tractuosa (strain ATCC 23168 / DSM 4126 / NBRC 15989 / NCIMB 1408 / VKM B-1430 / H-43) TaxID=643867 RepID=E4TPE7_MARTH|nr:peroxiredoxin [Marivirga tractuosa]ADR21535.1 alkyl hydroperoxide reductase/ Thiol specific antioxidant/ Mal allergen [Marivirga tractuosa DSM 4126]BDD14011.1 peroxiredoxin [Marivirga tractuosa]